MSKLDGMHPNYSWIINGTVKKIPHARNDCQNVIHRNHTYSMCKLQVACLEVGSAEVEDERPHQEDGDEDEGGAQDPPKHEGTIQTARGCTLHRTHLKC